MGFSEGTGWDRSLILKILAVNIPNIGTDMDFQINVFKKILKTLKYSKTYYNKTVKSQRVLKATREKRY